MKIMRPARRVRRVMGLDRAIGVGRDDFADAGQGLLRDRFVHEPAERVLITPQRDQRM